MHASPRPLPKICPLRGVWRCYPGGLPKLPRRGPHATLACARCCCIEGGSSADGLADAMWSAYLDTSPLRAAGTRALGAVSRRAYYGPWAPLRTGSVRRPAPPGRRWVRVHNIVAGISGSDLAQIHLERDAHIAQMALPRQPRVYLGREVSGYVIEV